MELRFLRCSVALLLFLFVASNALRQPGVQVMFFNYPKINFENSISIFRLLIFKFIWKIDKVLIYLKNIEFLQLSGNFYLPEKAWSYTEKLFISIFTIVFFNLGKNVSLWEFLLVKILSFIIIIWNFSINYSKICYELCWSFISLL